MTSESPRRPWPLVFVLAIVAVLATAYLVVALSASQVMIDADGTARELPLAERLANTPAQILIPLASAVAAGAAAVGLVRGRRWGSSLGAAVGAGIIVGGGFLLFQAAREWGLEGSFSGLLVPPGVVGLAVGAYVVIAALGARRRLA